MAVKIHGSGHQKLSLYSIQESPALVTKFVPLWSQISP